MFFTEKIKQIAFVILGACCVIFSSCAKKQYHVGDIVMSDGTVVSKDSYISYKGKEKPVAVIFTVNGVQKGDSKRVIGVGLFESGSIISFAEDNSVYPAYAFAENYGINQKCGKFDSTDWYLPTVAELYEMFENKALLNDVIEVCGGNKLDHRIWSCSQDYYMKDVQLLLDMETGEVRKAFKDSQAHVRSVYCFADR